MDVAEQFGRNLFMARRRAGLTQDDLASQVSVCQPHVSKLESGQSYPRLDLVVKLADAVGVQVRALLNGIV